MPVAGGVSGSPLIDASGMVIGVVSGGNTAKGLREVADKVAEGEAADAKKEDGDKKKQKEAESFRIPSAAMINFAQRADLLDDLKNGVAERELAADQAYWDQAAQKFVSYFVVAAKEFVDLAGKRYGVDVPARQGDRQRHARAPQDRLIFVRVGRLTATYWSRAMSTASSPTPRAACGSRSTSEKRAATSSSETRKIRGRRACPSWRPAPGSTVAEPTTVEIDVSGLISQPAKYALYVYDWDQPAGQPAAEALSRRTAP